MRCLSFSEPHQTPMNLQGRARMRMDMNVLLPCVITIVIVITCWIPWLIVNGIISNAESEANINPELRVVTLASVYIPISSDPLIFIMASSKGRKALLKLIGKSRGTSDVQHIMTLGHNVNK